MTRQRKHGLVPAPFGTLFQTIPSDVSTGTALEVFESFLNDAMGHRQGLMDTFKSKVEYPKTDVYIESRPLFSKKVFEKDLDRLLQSEDILKEVLEQCSDDGFSVNVSSLLEEVGKLKEACIKAFEKKIEDLEDEDFSDYMVFEMSVPGLSKKELEIIYENDSLCIKGKKEVKNKVKFIRNELKHSSFMRTWGLPKEILDLNNRAIESSLEDGILKVLIPIKSEEKPKRVQVEIS